MQNFSFLCHNCQRKIVTKSEHLSLLALKAAESLTKNITDPVCQNLGFFVVVFFFINILKLKISDVNTNICIFKSVYQHA